MNGKEQIVELKDTELDNISGGSIIVTEEPFIADPGESIWESRINVPQPDGSKTSTVLSTKRPLRAGQYKIIRSWIGSDPQLDPGPLPDSGPLPDPGPLHDPGSQL